jgi:phosphate starvation-inducible PhoH-like protein
VLRRVEDIGMCELTSSDVVRHPLVQKIVKAYEDYESIQEKKKKRQAGRK